LTHERSDPVIREAINNSTFTGKSLDSRSKKDVNAVTKEEVKDAYEEVDLKDIPSSKHRTQSFKSHTLGNRKHSEQKPASHENNFLHTTNDPFYQTQQQQQSMR
jgi:hypothetical protein